MNDRALDRSTGAALIEGNQVELLRDGPTVFASWLRDIAKAQRYILFENYIINHDQCGTLIAEALCERARAGVQVRLLYDWLGCLGTSRRLWRRLRAAGVDVRAFNVGSLADPIRGFRRDHRKSMVVDGVIGHVGGLCVGDAWAGSLIRGVPPWRDTAVRIAGPAAAALCPAFNETWSLAGPPLQHDELNPALAGGEGDMPVRVVAGSPGRSRTYRSLHLLLSCATRRLWITDAYFLTPPSLYEALLAAARDGVDVRVLVPGRSDLPWVSFFSRAGFVGLLNAGVHIYEWDGPMLHAKTAVIDGRYSRVGSSNLNLASLLTNWELDVLVECPRFAVRMEEMFLQDLANASELMLRTRAVAFRGRIQRVVPVLEVAAPPLGEAAVAEAPMVLQPRKASQRAALRRARGALLSPGGRAGAAVARASAALLGVALRRQIEQSAWVVSLVMALTLVTIGALGLWRPQVLGSLVGGILLWLGVGALRHAIGQWRRRAVLPPLEPPALRHRRQHISGRFRRRQAFGSPSARDP